MIGNNTRLIWKFGRMLTMALHLAFMLLVKAEGGAKESSSRIKQQQQQQQLQNINHAIIVPYRNRTLHLQVFRQHMVTYLEEHFPNETFSIWIMEQANDELFWKSWLVNAGYKETTQTFPSVKCVTMHDVDMIPASFVPYNSCDFPMEQIRQVPNKKDWIEPNPYYFGGAVTLSQEHWLKINGMGNEYRGWGCEDDDVYYRLRANNLLINVNNSSAEPKRPPDGQGVFSAIDESKEHHPIMVDKAAHNFNCGTLLGQMKRFGDRWKWDGLSNVCYTVVTDKSSVSVEGKVSFHHVKVAECAESDHSSDCPVNEMNKEENTEIDTAPLEAYLKEHPYDSHAWLNLADAYKAAGELEKAKEHYRKRIEVGGSYVYEIWNSQLNLGILAEQTNESDGTIVTEFLKAFELNSYRAGPLHHLARYFRKKGQLKKAYIYASAGVKVISEDVKVPRFPNLEHFLFEMLQELCIAAFYTGQTEEGREACQSILDLAEQQRVNLSMDTIGRIKKNLEFYKS